MKFKSIIPSVPTYWVGWNNIIPTFGWNYVDSRCGNHLMVANSVYDELREIALNRYKYFGIGELFLDVAIAIREFCKMGLHDEVLLFHEWDTSIRQKVDKKITERYDDSQYELSSCEMWMMYCNIARRNFPEKYAYMVEEEPRTIERRNEMIAELAPLIEKYGFEIEEDIVLPFLRNA